MVGSHTKRQRELGKEEGGERRTVIKYSQRNAGYLGCSWVKRGNSKLGDPTRATKLGLVIQDPGVSSARLDNRVWYSL